MTPFTIPGPSVLSSGAADDPDDDPLLALASLALADCAPPAGAGTRTRTASRPAVRPQFVSTVTAAARLGVSLDTIRKLIKGGRIRAAKWGDSLQARWRIPVGELERLGDAPPPAGDL